MAAISALPAHSFLLDGEVIVTNGDGLAVFELVRRVRHGDNDLGPEDGGVPLAVVLNYYHG